MYKKVTLLLIPPFFSILTGIIGFVSGVMIGGNWGCFSYQGLVGYEACGVFFLHFGLLIGFIIGLYAAILRYKKLQKK